MSKPILLIAIPNLESEMIKDIKSSLDHNIKNDYNVLIINSYNRKPTIKVLKLEHISERDIDKVTSLIISKFNDFNILKLEIDRLKEFTGLDQFR